ncbi:MAG: type II secretion system protein M [bacterium]|nr:MAG: type II secretion system protein M [bacterium]
MLDLLRRLSPRERILVMGAGAFVLAAVLYGLVLDPLMGQKRRYEGMVERKRADLAEFRDLAARYRSTQASLDAMERRVAAREPGTSLLATMEAEARKLGLADRIASMKPVTSELESGMVESSVEIRIEKVDLKGLVEFLRAVENGPLMARAARLRVRTRFDDPQLMDVTILASTLEAP